MDPLSAFGIAANVFAVIGFASELVKLGIQIHKTGDSDQFAQAEQAAEGMQCCTNLILNQGLPLFTSGTQPQEDQAFIHLAEASVTISREIVCLLDEVRGAGSQSRPWKTFRQTFKTIMNRDTLDRLSKQLDQVRESLQLHTVVSIKQKMEKESLKLDHILDCLDDGTKASVPAFLDNFSALRTQGHEILANQLRVEQVATQRHEQLLGTLGEISLQGGRPRSWQQAEQGYPHVAFLHRTVYEFVSSPEIRQELDKAATPAGGDSNPFCPDLNLLRSAILRIKSFSGSQYLDGSGKFPVSLEVLVYRCLSLARKAEIATGKAETRLLTEFDRTMTCFFQRYNGIPDSYTHWSEALLYQGDIPDGSGHSNGSFLSLSVRHGLVNFVRDHISASGNAVIQKTGRPLLDYALRPGCTHLRMRSSFIIPWIPAMVELLTKHGANPNEGIPGTGKTVWTVLLTSLCTSESVAPEVPVILKTLILCGADSQVKLRLVGQSDESTLLELCQYLFNRSERTSGSRQEFENGMVELMRLLASRKQQEIDIIHGLDGGAGGLTPVVNLGVKRRSLAPRVGRGEGEDDEVVKTGGLRNWWRRQKRISFRS